MKTEESGVSHAAVVVQPDTVYNLISTDPSQAFAAYIYTTYQRTYDFRYTKGVSIGYTGELIILYYFRAADLSNILGESFIL